jgi:hypothetical protein
LLLSPPLETIFMKRTLELVTFISFVSIVLFIILAGVTPIKNDIDEIAKGSVAKAIFPLNNTVLIKTGLQTPHNLSFLSGARK